MCRFNGQFYHKVQLPQATSFGKWKLHDFCSLHKTNADLRNSKNLGEMDPSLGSTERKMCFVKNVNVGHVTLKKGKIREQKKS